MKIKKNIHINIKISYYRRLRMTVIISNNCNDNK